MSCLGRVSVASCQIALVDLMAPVAPFSFSRPAFPLSPPPSLRCLRPLLAALSRIHTPGSPPSPCVWRPSPSTRRSVASLCVICARQVWRVMALPLLLCHSPVCSPPPSCLCSPSLPPSLCPPPPSFSPSSLSSTDATTSLIVALIAHCRSSSHSPRPDGGRGRDQEGDQEGPHCQKGCWQKVESCMR